MVNSLNTGGEKRFVFLSSTTFRVALLPTQLPIEWVPGIFPASKAARVCSYVVDHSPPSITKVKTEWSYTSVPPICLHRVDRDNFTFFAFIVV
jgi:hypothetical protein